MATRSTRAVTRSPGMAPLTRTICPAFSPTPPARAIIRPPAAGFSIVSVSSWPASIGMGSRSYSNVRVGKRALPHQPVDGGLTRRAHRRRAAWSRERPRAHRARPSPPRGARRRSARQTPPAAPPGHRPRAGRRAPAARHRASRAPRRVRHRIPPTRRSRKIVPRRGRAFPATRACVSRRTRRGSEVRRQRTRPFLARRRFVPARRDPSPVDATFRLPPSQGAPPFVKHVEHVGLPGKSIRHRPPPPSWNRARSTDRCRGTRP